MSHAILVDAQTLRHRLQQSPSGVRILDVRTAGEFETIHIPGSYHVPLDTLAEHRHELSRLGEGAVLVCQSGARAQQAARQLAEMGVSGTGTVVQALVDRRPAPATPASAA